MADDLKQVLEEDYRNLKNVVEQKTPKAISVPKQRELFVLLGKMTFIYDFARGNLIDTSWTIKGREIFHEFYIKKHFMGFDASTLASTTTDQKRATKWLETGWHERYCHYKGKFSDANFANPSIACDVVNKKLKKWKVK